MVGSLTNDLYRNIIVIGVQDGRYESGANICYVMGLKVTVLGRECNRIKNVTNQ